MRTTFLLAFMVSAFAFSAPGPTTFDGVWQTTVTCDAAGGTRGYTFNFVSTVASGVMHGQKGEPSQPASLAIDGKIGNDGSAKLTASGVTGAAEYTHGPFKSEGASYSYEVKAHFSDTEGKGERSTGLGIIGRPCHWTFVRQAATPAVQ